VVPYHERERGDLMSELRVWIHEHYGRIAAPGRHAIADDEPSAVRERGPIGECGHREPRAPADAKVRLCSTCVRTSLVEDDAATPESQVSVTEGRGEVGIPGAPEVALSAPVESSTCRGIFRYSGKRRGRPRIHESATAGNRARQRAYRQRQADQRCVSRMTGDCPVSERVRLARRAAASAAVCQVRNSLDGTPAP